VKRAAETSTPGRRVVAGWLAAYVALSLLFCAPFVGLTTLDRTPDRGDARLITWLLAWHAHWPLTGESPLDAPVFAPEPGSLGASDPMIALGLAATPLTALAGPVAAFNLVRLVLPVLNALAMAWLAWHLLRDAWAAFAAGLVLAFSYSQIAAVYLGMLNLGVLGGFALSPLFLDRWWQSGRWRELGAAVGIACLQALVSWYAAVLVVIVIAVQVTWYLVIDHGTTADLRRRVLALGASAAVAGALLWPLARPVLGLPAPTLDELRLYAVQPEFYVTPPHDTLAGNLMHGGRAITVSWDYRSYFPGVVVAVAALAGLVRSLGGGGHRRLWWLLGLGVVGAALSLGPSGPETGWRPFDLVSAIPGVGSFRAPSRMAVLVTIALAGWVGVAVRALPRRRRGLVVLALLPLFVAEHHMTSLNYTPAAPVRVSPLLSRLAGDHPTAALVVPMLGGSAEWPFEADYMLLASQAGWTPIVNGYGRRTPPVYTAIYETVDGLPRAPLGEVLRFYGVSHVLVLPRYEAARAAAFIAAADASADFERVAESDGDVLYRVRPDPD
jgi:hypothetical protein